MKNIIIAGGTGFIGKELVRFLVNKGHSVSLLSRNPRPNSEFENYFWDPSTNIIDPNALENKDIIINLSGVRISSQPWTDHRKRIILNSRILSTRLLVDTILQNNLYPTLFINASAIGFYGDRPNEKLSELSDFGKGFLSEVCSAWEKEAFRLKEHGIPFSIFRFGIVLSEKGGSLPLLMLPIKFRFNILFEKGNHYISWIHISDLIKIFSETIDDNLLPGLYNAVSPFPIKQDQLNRIICKILGKSTLCLSIPKVLLKFLLGELNTLFTDDQYVEPGHLLAQDFKFNFPEIEVALEKLLKQ
jgi:uncharacterized protein (TIGR01777 family)